MTEQLLLVVGSLNYDLIFRHERLPAAGETVAGATLTRSCGGKGANQAVAAARCARILAASSSGGERVKVAMAGAVGDDPFGAAQRRALDGDGVDVTYVETVPAVTTGISAVWVEARSGENRILNAPGANLSYGAERIASVPVEEAAMVLLQNEIPATTLRAVAARARAAGVPVLWNPAPLQRDEEVALRGEDGVRFITPNELEAAALLASGVDPGAPEAALRRLQECGYRGVIVTLGAGGVAVADGDAIYTLAAPRVEAVDTTGAGDAFSGAFAAALVAGRETREAAELAVRYATASVRAPGTQISYPRHPS